jgi:hypothetical protein
MSPVSAIVCGYGYTLATPGDLWQRQKKGGCAVSVDRPPLNNPTFLTDVLVTVQGGKMMVGGSFPEAQF